ncbi:hypothetical protein RR48_12620 [Papilio machaon]|uniref:Uncharacterized protein n=1 Tax=Papilio machaon TaxID=76193 RepID=A0A194RNX3_PAPMA|nr:hypothetical protein RR48_12620 [Papilio machaon]
MSKLMTAALRAFLFCAKIGQENAGALARRHRAADSGLLMLLTHSLTLADAKSHTIILILSYLSQRNRNTNWREAAALEAVSAGIEPALFAVLALRQRLPLILVGAPEDDPFRLAGVSRPGAVYRCDPSRRTAQPSLAPCSIMDFDKNKVTYCVRSRHDLESRRTNSCVYSHLPQLEKSAA